jgi:hypothetical protein
MNELHKKCKWKAKYVRLYRQRKKADASSVDECIRNAERVRLHHKRFYIFDHTTERGMTERCSIILHHIHYSCRLKYIFLLIYSCMQFWIVSWVPNSVWNLPFPKALLVIFMLHFSLHSVHETWTLLVNNKASVFFFILQMLSPNKLTSVAQLLEALRYKVEGRGCDSCWCQWNFSLT